jgi:hypothetical protein
MKSTFQTKTLEDLHAEMVKMSDAQLTEHGKMLRSYCRPVRGQGIDRAWLKQLNEARAEWRCRHPSKQAAPEWAISRRQRDTAQKIHQRSEHISERHGLDLMADFVMTELELGRTFCQLAENYKNVERSNRAIENARKAFETAQSYMWKLRMKHAIFDEMTASVEGLRLELEALSRKGAMST